MKIYVIKLRVELWLIIVNFRQGVSVPEQFRGMFLSL